MPHWPLLQAIQALDGFEFVAALLWSIVVFAGIGFASDYIFNSKGPGPYWSAAYAALGGYVGLCAHDWWFGSFPAYEPELTIYMIVAGLLTAILGAAAIWAR